MTSAASLGIRAWSGTAAPMREAHRLEINFVRRGEMKYFLAGRFPVVRERRLAVFWAGLPHQLTAVAPHTELIWVTIPLPWFLQWRPGEALTRRRLAGEWVETPDASAALLDEALLQGWVEDFRHSRTNAGEPALLEIEARMRRLARALAARPAEASAHAQPAVGGDPIARATRYIGEHYAEPLSVEQIAAAAGVNANYLMTLFRRQCGMSVWEYIRRLRVAHAQLLLLTPDRKMLDVALDSGFASASRFYAAFRHYCADSPGAYRAAARGQVGPRIG